MGYSIPWGGAWMWKSGRIGLLSDTCRGQRQDRPAWARYQWTKKRRRRRRRKTKRPTNNDYCTVPLLLPGCPVSFVDLLCFSKLIRSSVAPAAPHPHQDAESGSRVSAPPHLCTLMKAQVPGSYLRLFLPSAPVEHNTIVLWFCEWAEEAYMAKLSIPV